MILQIRHIENPSEKSQFEVIRLNDGKHSEVTSLTPPDEVTVGTSNKTLQGELQWYLEKYLKLPMAANKTKSEAIQKALRQWGRDTFDLLFGSGHANDWYQEARQVGLHHLIITITSNSPAVLMWPWETMESAEDGCLALQCNMERQLCKIPDAGLPKNKLPGDRLNILYIIARPGGKEDVGFQILSRPLVDFAFAENESWPVYIKLLRPPTFAQLQAVLSEQPDFYHIIHFDGHGGYSKYNAPGRMDSDPYGTLIFEKDNDPKHSGDPISAKKLGELLSKHNIPVVILNACRSAMMDKQAKDPFVSVAAGLINAGVGSVVAMSYNLWVSGAKEFIPAFYRQLLTEGSISEAVRWGRWQMHERNERDTIAGRVEFDDWIVPVLYQQKQSFSNSILPQLSPGEAMVRNLPVEALGLKDNDFIGRDRAIFMLEQVIQRQPQAGILIYGMSGEGKTTLARGFLKWLEDTNGLGEEDKNKKPFWFTFGNIRSAADVINTLVEKLLGTSAFALGQERIFSLLVEELKKEQYFLVWDNFESASGIPGTEVSPLLSEEDRQILKRFLYELHGGRTKVIITSRSTEQWLTDQERFYLSLGGLREEELWQYCNAVIDELKPDLDRNDKKFKKLIEELDGNPLAIRIVLSELKRRPLAAILTEYDAIFNDLKGDKNVNRIQAALAVFERGLDRNFEPVLRLLGLHEHCADAHLMESNGAAHLPACFSMLESAGLCQPMGKGKYRLHPALHGCLTRLYPANDDDKRAFVEFMGARAIAFALMPSHKQRTDFTLFGTNYYNALDFARKLDVQADVRSLVQGLAVYFYNTRRFTEAANLYKELAQTAHNNGETKAEATAYHQLGVIALGERKLAAARDWHQQSLAISYREGYADVAVIAHYQMGRVLEEMKEFSLAWEQYQQSLVIETKGGKEEPPDAARTYHQLGTVALELGEYPVAVAHYKQSLKIKKRYGDEEGMATTFQQLGTVWLKQGGELATAINWYQESLRIKEIYDNEEGKAITYHHMGIVAQRLGYLDAAEDLYVKSLLINKKYYRECDEASDYNQLGTLAKEKGDLPCAETWYNKALAIYESMDDQNNAALVRTNLAILKS